MSQVLQSYAQSIVQAMFKLLLGEGIRHEVAIVPVPATAKVGYRVQQDRKGDGYAIAMLISDAGQASSILKSAAAKALHRITEGKTGGKPSDACIARANRVVDETLADSTIANDFYDALDTLIRASKPRSMSPLVSLMLEGTDVTFGVKINAKEEDIARSTFSDAGFRVWSLKEWQEAHPKEKAVRPKATEIKAALESTREELETARAENIRLLRLLESQTPSAVAASL